MADKEQEAIKLLAQAEAKLKPGGFISGIFGGGNRTEEACELYCRAANMFKMAKKWSSAGNAFLDAGTLQQKNGNWLDAGVCFVDAGNCFKKSEPIRAVECFQKAIEIYTDKGRFSIAAKNHVAIAELFENDLNDIDKAIVHYEQAADYYKGEESHSSANKYLLEVAKHCAQQEKYEKAIEIYEQVASTCIDSSILKYSAGNYFFRAALCHLCVDPLNATHALSKYDEMYPSFSGCREYKLVQNLVAKLEDQDVDGFTQAVADYDSIVRLDQWYTTLLLRVKKTIQGESGLC